VASQWLARCEDVPAAVNGLARSLTPVVRAQVTIPGTTVWWGTQTRHWLAYVPSGHGARLIEEESLVELLKSLSAADDRG